MNKLFVQTAWQIMESLRDADILESALSSSLEILQKSIGCEDGAIWMMDDQSESIIAVSCCGPNNYVGMGAKPETGILDRVMSSGNSETDGPLPNGIPLFSDDDTTHFPLENILCVPLKTPQNTLGCIHLGNKKDGDFTDEEIQTVENCAAIIALDIEDKGFQFRPNEDRKAILSLRGIVKEFMSGDEIRRILDGIDLDVYEGELLVILGESGCGKSTLLNIIGGMDQMTEGSIEFNGQDFSHPTEEELTDYRRNSIGFIFQAYNLMPNLSALENVRLIAELVDSPKEPLEALDLVGMKEKANNYPSTLSGGQQQRVSIARAIAKNPMIILADEPTAALDFETGQSVLMTIEKIVKEQKATVIMVTHNVEITKMANRVIKLRSGGHISSMHVNLHPVSAKELEW